MKTTRLDPKYCWACGTKTDASTSIEADHTPSPGDVSVCFYCAAVNVFTERLQLRAPTVAEVAVIDRDERVQRLRDLVLREKFGRDKGEGQP